MVLSPSSQASARLTFIADIRAIQSPGTGKALYLCPRSCNQNAEAKKIPFIIYQRIPLASGRPWFFVRSILIDPFHKSNSLMIQVHSLRLTLVQVSSFSLDCPAASPGGLSELQCPSQVSLPGECWDANSPPTSGLLTGSGMLMAGPGNLCFISSFSDSDAQPENSSFSISGVGREGLALLKVHLDSNAPLRS